MCRCRVRSTWHLHEFEIAGRRHGIPDPDSPSRHVIDETKVKLFACRRRAIGSATSTTSATAGPAGSPWTRSSPPSRGCATRVVSQGREPAHRRTSAASGHTRESSRSRRPTPPIPTTTSVSSGRAVCSTRTASSPLRPTVRCSGWPGGHPPAHRRRSRHPQAHPRRCRTRPARVTAGLDHDHRQPRGLLGAARLGRRTRRRQGRRAGGVRYRGRRPLHPARARRPPPQTRLRSPSPRTRARHTLTDRAAPGKAGRRRRSCAVSSATSSERATESWSPHTKRRNNRLSSLDD